MSDDLLSQLEKVLPEYTSEQFSTLVPKSMLGLTDAQMQTVQFAFWFCYVVEKDLTDILQESVSRTREILGKTESETYEYMKKTYGIKFEIVDEEHPKHDPYSIVFNDRIDLVEKIRGRDAHTVFLRKVKAIRNDLSHGRIMNLSYDEKSLFEDATKASMIRDYVSNAINFKEGAGGAIADASPQTHARVETLFKEYKMKKGLNWK